MPANLDDFATLREIAKRDGREPFVGSLLSFDPGETTGVAHFHFTSLKGYHWEAWQVSTKGGGTGGKQLQQIVAQYSPDVIICESYQVYKSKLKQHTFSDIHTLRLIGAIEFICDMLDMQPIMQTAHTAKGFCTDEKLKDWDMWIKGEPHSRDAIRHACYFALFGSKHYPPKNEEPSNGTRS